MPNTDGMTLEDAKFYCPNCAAHGLRFGDGVGDITCLWDFSELADDAIDDLRCETCDGRVQDESDATIFVQIEEG